ncbi:hypothetical protein HYC85_011588 [Camellia sinensis]|uniref:Uncharacterized protein n=1 Tax=Camellia sinensis TaxID=4442 RepID=A0A7J7HAF1_CAMSI|nr:hypothetical protein HYC85_011588 [Camellia sinensis]
MQVTNHKRKTKGQVTTKGSKAQMGNRFELRRENQESEAQPQRTREQGQTSSSNEEMGFKYKAHISLNEID